MSDESELFNHEVPRRLQTAILRAVFDGCIFAHEQAKKVASEWFNDAVPAHRRLAVEPLLHQIVLPKNFRATAIRTPSTKYTQIESDRVVITAVTRNYRRQWVRPEPYRKTLAKEAQLVFEAMRAKASGDVKKLYALLVYGGPHAGRLPQLADVAFPTANGNFAPGTINLLTAFPSIVESYTARPATEPSVALRIVKKKKDDDGA